MDSTNLGPATPQGHTAHALYFGPPERPLFGWLHRPASAWSGTRVVLCAPLGYEGLFAHLTLRALARHLSGDGGAAVLRFDYDGTGDSAGSDEDPDRVGRWTDSISLAIEELRRLAPGDGPTVLVGMRAGALLAAGVAARSQGVAGLLLWAPCISGRAFVREQRAFSRMASSTASRRGASELAWGEGGFEANGYVFSSETVAALGALDLSAIKTAPSPAVLVLDRDDAPCNPSAFDGWRGTADSVTYEAAPGYASLMQPPLQWQEPSVASMRIGAWIASLARGSARPSPPPPAPQSAVRLAPGVSSCPLWYDDDGYRFGILTEPDRASKRAMVFLNNAAGYHVGPHRMNPLIAGSLAAQGVASLLADVAGVGDSDFPPGRTVHHPYSLAEVDDVRAMVVALQRRGYVDIAIGGLCSGAYLAWHAAKSVPGIRRLLLLNPQTFAWSENDSLEVSPIQEHYEISHLRAALRSGANWAKLFRGEVAVGPIVTLGQRRIRRVVSDRLSIWRSKLGIARKVSEVAAQLESFVRQGLQVTFTFSGSDPGINYCERELGPSMSALIRSGHVKHHVIEGPDHSFTSRWATRRLADAIIGEFAAQDSANPAA